MSNQGADARPDLPAELAAALRADARRRCDRDEEFWSRQRSHIRARIRAGSEPRPQPLRIAAAGALVLFLAVLLTAPAGRPPQPVPNATVDADQQLLVAVERALASGTPEALEPLTLLVESNSNPNDVDAISNKERRHED